MRFLIVNYDYPEFLDWLYRRHPRLARAGFDEQRRVRVATRFGLADYYSHNLAPLGHEALEIQFNNWWMQRAWLRENGYPVPSTPGFAARLVLQPAAARLVRPPLARLVRRITAPPLVSHLWLEQALATQVRHYRPDVLLVQYIYIDPALFRALAGSYRLLVGQHAAPLPEHGDLGVYDLMLSSLPNLVAHFRAAGLRVELLRHAFEPRLLAELPEGPPDHGVTFVGRFPASHGARRRWLASLAARVGVEVWAPPADAAFLSSVEGVTYRGPAWGLDMYRALRSSRVTLNHHIDMAGGHANNLRLVEATGVGAPLVTDGARDIADLFEPGHEVAVYRSAEECAELVVALLADEASCRALGAAGQRRTLRDHAYPGRMAELSALVAGRLP